jgi:hypothetical protein
MRNACFVVPIHFPKFNYGLELIRSYNKYFNDDHLYFVFNSQEDAEYFANLDCDIKFRFIICPELKSRYMSEEKFLKMQELFKNSPMQIQYSDSFLYESAVTEKKFVGMKWIFENTEFENVAAIDADCVFTRNINYSNLFEEHISNATLYGSFAPDSFNPMIISPFKFFKDQDRLKLYSITEHCKTYFWFNDLTIFNKQYFLDFLNYIDYENTSKDLCMCDFDFIIYAYYLLIKDIYKLEMININDTNIPAPLIESQRSLPTDVFKQLFIKYNPMWIMDEIEPEYMNKCFMRVHVDR